MNDRLFVLRMLAKRPGFYAVVILTLALGIGANSSVFSFVKLATLDALPYRESGQLVAVWQDFQRRGGPEREWFSFPSFVDFQAETLTLTALGAISENAITISGGGDPESMDGAAVSANFFDLLGVRFARGRGFRTEESLPGAAPVAVLSYRLWQRRYGGDPGIIGSKIVLDDRPNVVVGILPQGFYAPFAPATAIFTPLYPPSGRPDRTELTLRVIGRLKPKVSLAQARSDLASIAGRIQSANADAPRDVSATAYPLRDETMGEAKPILMVLFTTAAFVLLISCVNVANLLLAQAASRRGEIGIRTALGADRSRLVRQLFTESLLLSFVGGVVGLGVAVLGVQLLKRLALAAAFPLPGLDSVGIDAGVLLFNFGVAIFTGLLFGLWPAIEASRKPDLTTLLKDGSGMAGGRSATPRSARVLVAFEIALALVLLVGSGLMLRSLDRLLHVDTGFRTSEVLVFQVQTPESRYPEDEQWRAFYSGLVNRLKSLPGVLDAGAISSLPLAGDNTDSRFQIVGRGETANGVRLWYRAVTPGYFRAAGLPIIKGRDIEDRDSQGAADVAILNESAVRSYLQGADPIGQVLTNSARRFLVIGVVKNARSFSLSEEEPPAVYFSFRQVTSRAMGLFVRAKRNPQRLVQPIRAMITNLDPAMAATGIRPLSDVIESSLAPQKALSALMSAFSVLALLLAAVGLYGLMAHLTGQRTREIGIRMAIGSTASGVLRLVLGQALKLAAIGVATGLLSAFALTRVIKSMLFEVSAFDPTSFALSAGLLIVVTLAASFLPARRASLLPPASVLRG